MIGDLAGDSLALNGIQIALDILNTEAATTGIRFVVPASQCRREGPGAGREATAR